MFRLGAGGTSKKKKEKEKEKMGDEQKEYEKIGWKGETMHR